MKTSSVRLPTWFSPTRYELVLTPNLTTARFDGSVIIHYTLAKATRVVTLHAADLTVACEGASVTYNDKAETVTLAFATPLKKGSGRLALSFKGILNNDMRGFYKSTYTHRGKTRTIATTQFEATDARRAFPCVDEPAVKAVFDVTIIAQKELAVVSNTTEASVTKVGKGHKRVTFTPTPKMSTYLLAFIVGDFEHLAKKTKRGTLVRVHTTPGKKRHGHFALDTAVRCLEFYEHYFGIHYPLPTLDMLAIPDFSAGAMENWGAVTYREARLLVDPNHSSAATRQDVALVIAHELAHQWFGNLVTMEWWTHLWLNEGFASYMEYVAVDHLFPEWDIWTQFVVGDLTPALELDSLHHTHAIEIPVVHPSEIREIFDAVSYSKGSSIIRMLVHWLGETTFRNGLRRYLKLHAYGNAVTEDLWSAMEDVSGKPVRKAMKDWTSAPGYPTVQVVQKPRGLSLVQSRFYLSERSRKAQRDQQTWMIPITYRREHDAAMKRLFLDKRREHLAVSLKEGEWLKLNVGATGMYRVDYPAPILARLTELVEDRSLPPADRFSILSDASALARSGELPTRELLRLLSAYRNEESYSVWTNVVRTLIVLEQFAHGAHCDEAFRAFARELTQPMVKRLGWKEVRGEPHATTLLRSLMLREAGRYGNEEVVREARRLFASYTQGRALTPNLRSLVYSISAQTGGQAEYEHLIQRYRSEQLSEEKNRLGHALTQLRDPRLLMKTLAFALSKSVRVQDGAFMVAAVLRNPAIGDAGWKYIRHKWPMLKKRYGSATTLHKLVLALDSSFSAKRAQEVKQFFKKNRAPGAERAVRQTVETIQANADWLARDGAAVKQWLKQRQKS